MTKLPNLRICVVFLGPALFLYSVFMVYPLIGSLLLSFQRPSGAGPELEIVGMSNYVALLTQEPWSTRFWGALGNNVVFFAIQIAVQSPLGLLLATLLSSRRLRFRGAYRALLFSPAVISVVIAGFIWQLMLSPLWGIVRDALAAMGLGSWFQPWLGLEGTALLTVSLIGTWQFLGIPMMLYLAALLAIPNELLEAARVDGASVWTVFRRVQFPLIVPTVGIVTVLTYAGCLNAFDLIYVLQGSTGSPNYSTDMLGTYFYRTFFGSPGVSGNLTMGATIAMATFILVLAGLVLYFIGWQRRILTVEL